MMTPTPQTEPLYIFAVWMLGSRDAALAHLHAVLNEADTQTSALQALVARLIAVEKPSRVDPFADLDDKLRTNFTIPVGLNHPLVQGDPRRLNILFWELQRRCLHTALQGLTPLRRAVFILRHVLGHPPESCVQLCNSTLDAVRTAEGRARRELEDYLGARCEHLYRGNSCHCTARLGNALECGLVRWPDHGDHDGSAFIPKPHSDVAALYASLPRVRLPVLAGEA